MLLNCIYAKAPIQRKKIKDLISSKDDYFISEFEDFLSLYTGYLSREGITIHYVVDAYLDMINNMLRSQIKFIRSGKYPVSKIKDAIDNVYYDKEKMLSYMVGLALSQYLWSTHYEMFSHLKSAMKENRRNISSYLEIGPGHGLFLKNAIDILNDDINITAIDISPTSLSISQSIISYFFPEKDVRFINEDMLDLDLDSAYDFIVAGEVIEHVEKPQLLLSKITSLLSKNGKAFISTCINCPMVDHLYHFKLVEDVRHMLDTAGLYIESEKVLPVEKLELSEIIRRNITINYSAIVRKA
jgi:2-polyprenyl-3-methyl-5-hydroxy-6-metoxy-1,4-benzoquinol methylase